MAIVEKEKQDKVEPQKQIVLCDEAEALKQATEAKVIKDECEAALSTAMPILEEALAALDTLTANDINYVKKLTNPPAAIKLVMEAVCVLLEVKPAKVPDGKGGSLMDYWKPSVLLLNKADFLTSLKEFDKDSIDPKVIGKIRSTYTNNADFTPAKAANASTAAEGLCKWVIAIDKYDVVAKVVAPKKAKLAAAEGLYEKVMVGLRAKQGELKQILDKLAIMEKELDVNMAKKESLQVCVLSLTFGESF
jgi:dynein heavy chain